LYAAFTTAAGESEQDEAFEREDRVGKSNLLVWVVCGAEFHYCVISYCIDTFGITRNEAAM